MDTFTKAAQNRSIRTIKTELDFLLDSSLLTPSQVSQITAILPSSADSSSSNPISNGTNAYHPPTRNTAPTSPPPSNAFNSLSLSEKAPAPYRQPSPNPPPPAYTSGPPGIATATSLYAYYPTDDGDLALQPNDRVIIAEYMNADWAKGRNERTGEEGIFPRSYVNIVEEKKGGAPPPGLPVRNQTPAYNSGYGNMAVEVAGQSGTGMANQGPPVGGGPQGQGQGSSKVNEQGKKFGKKLGNAAIFGAGASIGGNIVNSIF